MGDCPRRRNFSSGQHRPDANLAGAYHTQLGEAKGRKEANAIACLDRILAATRMVPTKTEIGQAIGAHPGSLRRMKVFAVRYRPALRRYRPKVRPRSEMTAAEEEKAIAFLDETISATDRRPSLSEIARYVRVDRKTLLRRPRFAANWQAKLAYKRRASRGSRNSYKATLEDQAIKLLNALVDSAGIRPSLRTIARRLKTSHPALLNRPRFMALWQAAKMRAKPQRPGVPPNATEDEALAYLAEAVRSLGHRPAKYTIARALGIDRATLNAWSRFRAAHRERLHRRRRGRGTLADSSRPRNRNSAGSIGAQPRDNWTEYPLSISVNQQRRLVRRTGFDKQVSLSASPVCSAHSQRRAVVRARQAPWKTCSPTIPAKTTTRREQWQPRT